MVSKLRLPTYFNRKLSVQMEELFAAVAISDLGISIVMLFEPIFLYSVLNFSIPEVLGFFAAVYFFYILFIPLGARIVSIKGYYHGIFYSLPCTIIYWLSLFGAREYPQLIYVAPIFFAMEKALFWPAFHASVARFANDGQKGREFSVIYAIINFTRILGPWIGGMVGAKFGLQGTLLLASAVHFFSFIPLFLTKEVFVPKPYMYKWTWQMYKLYPRKFLGYLGFGEELLVVTVWPIFIYTIVQSVDGTGLLVTLSTLISTCLAVYVGRIVDKGSKTGLIKIGALFSAMIFGVRFLANSFLSVFAIDSLSRTAKDLVFIPLSTVTYERAESTHIMPYVVFFEQSLAIGKLLACVLGILLFIFTGGSFMALFLLAGVFSLIYMLV